MSSSLVRMPFASWISVATTSVGNCLCAFDEVNIEGRRFAVRENIGEGGFSTVDLIQDKRTRRYYVLKRIVCHGKDDEAKALNEVKYHERFNTADCENLIQMECFAVKKNREGGKSSISSRVLIVLPYYRRGTLQSELEFRKSSSSFIEESRVLRLFLGICRGVAAIHSPPPELAGRRAENCYGAIGAEIDFASAFPPAVAHRDVKPANVLLSDDDVPILMDFGSCDEARVNVTSSKMAVALQDSAAERCTMPYRAPELFTVSSHCVVDERTDVWSLGCLLYALCFLEGPFDKAYQRGDSLALAANAGKISFPDSPQYSTGLIGLIKQTMRVSPSERPFVQEVIETVTRLQRQLEKRL